MVEAMPGSGIYVREQTTADSARPQSSLWNEFPRPAMCVENGLDELLRQGCSLNHGEGVVSGRN